MLKLALFIGELLILTICVLSLRRLPDSMPLAFTCSAAISAACHPPHPGDDEAQMCPVQWGVNSRDYQTGISHCAFTTARDVAPPIPGNYDA